MRSVTAREANQAFSRILKEAESGESVVITRRGQPVAIIAPGGGGARTRTRDRSHRDTDAPRVADRGQAFHPGRNARAVISFGTIGD